MKEIAPPRQLRRYMANPNSLIMQRTVLLTCLLSVCAVALGQADRTPTTVVMARNVKRLERTCTSLVRALHIKLNDGCQRLKWRVTLLQNASTREPTRYKIEGSLHHPAREGAWRIVRGTAADADAVVYQLDGTATEGPMLLWKADENVLFLLDERKQPLVGTVDFSYTLSRSQ